MSTIYNIQIPQKDPLLSVLQLGDKESMQDMRTLEEVTKISGYVAKVGTVFMLESYSKFKKYQNQWYNRNFEYGNKF